MVAPLPAPALRTSEEARVYFDELPLGDPKRGPAHDTWLNAMEREGRLRG